MKRKNKKKEELVSPFNRTNFNYVNLGKKKHHKKILRLKKN
jgi:hypothetical protein